MVAKCDRDGAWALSLSWVGQTVRLDRLWGIERDGG